MRIYVAGRFGRYERCRTLIDRLSAAGHEITHDWTRNEEFGADGHPLAADAGDVSIPASTQARLACDDLEGCATADLFVMIADEPLCGALIEMGAALANGVPCWVIAPWRWTIFWGHPLASVVDDEDAVLARLELRPLELRHD